MCFPSLPLRCAFSNRAQTVERSIHTSGLTYTCSWMACDLTYIQPDVWMYEFCAVWGTFLMLLLSWSRKHYQIILGWTTPLKTQATGCRTKYTHTEHPLLFVQVCLFTQCYGQHTHNTSVLCLQGWNIQMCISWQRDYFMRECESTASTHAQSQDVYIHITSKNRSVLKG